MVSTLMRGFKVTLTPRISVDIIALTNASFHQLDRLSSLLC